MPIARAPSLAKKNTAISRKPKRTGDAASRRPEPVELRRAGIVGTPRQGIKNTQLASRKWRRESTAETHLRAAESGGAFAEDPLPRSAGRSVRADRPSSIIGRAKKNTTISLKRTGDAASRRPEPVELRRAGIGGTPRQGIKNTQLASRKWRRESTAETHLRAAELGGACAEDPLPRSAGRSVRADRPSSIIG